MDDAHPTSTDTATSEDVQDTTSETGVSPVDHSATGHARAACEQVHHFNRLTLWEGDQTPADSADQLAEFAALSAALPQSFSQISTHLEQAMATQVLAMDAMTAETDPAMALETARLLLEEARTLAVDLHKMLDGAHQATAHVMSEGIDDRQETLPGELA